MKKLSPAEEITSEVRRVVEACRSLQSQLQQSIPRKNHEEAVARLAASVESATADYNRAKSDLENTTSIGQKVSFLETQIISQNDAISSQGRAFEALSAKLAESSIPFSAYSEAVSRVQALEAKISSMVDANEFASSQTRIAELEEKVSNMVPRSQFSSVELELAQSVPLQKYEDLLRNYEQMVPRDQLSTAEGRIVELERSLANSVPRQDFEDLTGRISQITREAAELVSRPFFSQPSPEVPAESPSAVTVVSTSIDTPALETYVLAEESHAEVVATPEVVTIPEVVAVTPEVVAPEVPQIEIPQAEAPRVEIENTTPEQVETVTPETSIPEIVEPVVTPQTETFAQPEPAPVDAITPSIEEAAPDPVEVATPLAEIATEVTEIPPAPQVDQVEIPEVETVAAAAPADTPTPPTTEITEVQSGLAEITSAIETGAITSPVPETSEIVDSDKGFRFSNTEYCAKSGMEFLEDVEKVDISVIVSHSQNGDFERWFHDVLVDEISAESLKAVREKNISGEELRTMLVAAVAPKYRAS